MFGDNESWNVDKISNLYFYNLTKCSVVMDDLNCVDLIFIKGK